jgi:hypothetical protein
VVSTKAGAIHGTILWTSGALPGKAHDRSAARVWGILRALETAGIVTLADKATKIDGYLGLSSVLAGQLLGGR